MKCSYEVYVHYEIQGYELVTSTPDRPRNAQTFGLYAVAVHVLKSKTDPAAEGQIVRVRAQPTNDGPTTSCPVRLLQVMWSWKRQWGEPVFTDARTGFESKPLEAATMRTRLKNYLLKFMSPEEVTHYGLHSLRRGGASRAAALGVPMRHIKRQGRWRSDVAYLYTLVTDQDLTMVSDQLLHDFAQS